MGAGKGKIVQTTPNIKYPKKLYDGELSSGGAFFKDYTKDADLNDLLIKGLEEESISARVFSKGLRDLGYTFDDELYLSTFYEVRTGDYTDYDGDNDEHLLISEKLKRALGKDKILPVVEDTNAPTSTTKQKFDPATADDAYNKFVKGISSTAVNKMTGGTKQKTVKQELTPDDDYYKSYNKSTLKDFVQKNPSLVKKYNTESKIRDGYKYHYIDAYEFRMLLYNIGEYMLAELNTYESKKYEEEASKPRNKIWDEAIDGKLTEEQLKSQFIRKVKDQKPTGRDKITAYLIKNEGYGVKPNKPVDIQVEKPPKRVKELPNTPTAKKNAKEVENVINDLLNNIDSPMTEKYKHVVMQLGQQSRSNTLGSCGVSTFSKRDTIYFKFLNDRLGLADEKDMWNISIINNTGDDSFKRGWNAAPGVIGVVAHEFGHAVEHYIAEIAPKTDYYRDFGLSVGFGEAFSEYSCSMDSEAFAEAFSMYACGIEPQRGRKENWEKFRKKMKQYGFDNYEGCLSKYVPKDFQGYLRPEFAKGTTGVAPQPKPTKSSVKKKVKDRVDNVRKQQDIDEIFKLTPVGETSEVKPKKEPKPKKEATKPKEEPKQEDHMATLIAKYSKYKTTSTLTKDYRAGKISQSEYNHILNALGKNTKSVKEAEPPKPKTPTKKTTPKKEDTPAKKTPTKKESTPVKEQKKPTTSKKVEPTKRKNGQKVTNTYSSVSVDDFNSAIDELLKKYNK